MTEEWPAACSLSDLPEISGEPAHSYLRAESSKILYKLCRDDFVRFHLRRLLVATDPGEWPLSSSIVRCQVESRHQVPSLYHSKLAMEDPAASVILAALDGTRDRDQLATILLESVRTAKIGINVGDTPLQDLPDSAVVARQIVEDQLQIALKLGLLMTPIAD